MNPDDAAPAALLLGIDPVGLGGVRLRARAGPTRDAWVALLRAALPPGAPVRRLPSSIDEAGLLGGLDLGASLQAGRPVAQQGLLAQADGGVLLAAMAERLPPARAAQLAAVLDDRELRLERDGLSARLPVHLAVVAFDEGLGEDEALPPALAERLGLHLDLEAIGTSLPTAPDDWMERSRRARERLPRVRCSDAMLQAVMEAAQVLGVASLRAAGFALRAARAAAAAAGRDEVDADDAALAVRLVLVPRATQAPAMAEPADEESEPAPEAPPPEAEAPPPPQAQPDTPARDPDDAAGDKSDEASDEDASARLDESLAERVLAAALAALPPDLLARLAAASASRTPGGAGRVGAWQTVKRGGRPVGSRRGELRAGARLHLVDTLRAAAPWQALRRAGLAREQVAGDAALAAVPVPGAHESKGARGSQAPKAVQPSKGGKAVKATEAAKAALAASTTRSPRPITNPTSIPRVLVRREDFHIVRQRQRRETTTIFVVDASGSAALHRLAEAKGAVELLLADCYVRRDRVALVSFRGGTGPDAAAGAELLLPPTRSLVRAKRALSGLPGGGGTPLAAGLIAAMRVVVDETRRGATPVTVILSDGRANIARDGTPGRARAAEDALTAARAFAAQGALALWLDTSPQPQDAARTLAQAMGARYLPLPHADARQVSAVAQAAVQGTR